MKSTSVSRQRWYILIAVGTATLLSTLNTSMMNTILPVVERDLHIPFVESEWIVLVYLLVLTLLLLPIGRLSDLVGYRTVFLSGFLLFAVSSVWCALSDTFLTLVFGRAFQAIAGAMLLSVGPALITSTFSPTERGKALGAQAVMTYLGLAVGPVLGGSITQFFNWQLTFCVSIPFAVVGFVLGWVVIGKTKLSTGRKVHPWETTLFMAAMGAAVFLFNPGVLPRGRLEITILLVALLLICASLFIRYELRLKDPMLDLRLFRIPDFGYGALGAAINYLCFYLMLFLIPFYLDEALHASPGITGIYLAIPPIVMTIVAPIAGALADKFGPRVLTAIGMMANVIALVCFGWMGGHGYSSAAALGCLVVGLLFAGVGNGAFAAPNNSAIMGAAPRNRQGVASGTLSTCRYVGMMAGITLGGSFLNLLMEQSGRHGTSAFLFGLSVTMWVGAGFGLIGVFVTLRLSSHTKVDRGETLVK